MRIIDITHPPQSLWIGREGENTFRPVSFECANWFSAYPNATIAAYYQPYGSSDPYPLVLTVDGTKRIWHPLLAELVKGDGELQIVLMNGETVGTSAIIPTKVDRSLISNAEHPASEAPSWTVSVVQDVTAQADRAEEATEHYPKIVGGYWYVWSVADGDFVSTGILAQGDDGYSPTVTVTAIEGGHRVTITDTDGAHTFDVMDGQGGTGGAVESVNGQTGAVVLDAEDVGALPDDTVIPSNTSDLTNDSGFVTAQQAAAVAPVQSVNGKTGSAQITASDLGAYVKPSGGIPASDLASGVIPSVPQMATQPDMSDWTSGKTVDAATLKTDFMTAAWEIDDLSVNKADKSEIPTKTSELENDSGYQTAQDVQTAISGVRQLPTVTASDNGKVLAVNNGEWSADSPVIVSGTDAQVANAVNDYLTQYGVPLRLSEEIKQALLDCFENVAWINDDGQTYYDALYAALYPPVDVLFISAVFTQGSAVIYDTDSLETLRQYLVVTATMTDSTTRTVTDYTLSGTLTVGTSTITVSYGGKTTTFAVTVTETPAQEELWINTLGATGSNANYAFAPFLLPASTYDYNYAKAITAIELDFIRSGSISVGYFIENPSAGSTYDQTKVHVHETISVPESGVNKLVLSTPMTIPSGAVLLVGIGTDTATFKYGGTMTNGFLYKGNDNKWASQTRTLGINVYRQ